MGGHGGLNILPQKRWHVYRDDNRLRVLRDEREFQAAVEAERLQQQRRVMSDVVTRFKRRKHGAAGDSCEANLQSSASSAAAGGASTQQPKSADDADSTHRNTRTAFQPQPLQGDLQGVAAKRPSYPLLPSAAPEKTSHTKQPSAAGGKKQRLAANGALVDMRGEAVVLAKPLRVNCGRVDALGRQQDGHFNFFAAAERETLKQTKERERYLLQAAHSTSRQSEFSCIARELKTVWYQSEMPSNRLAREEREERPQPARRDCDSVEAAAAEARRRMQQVQRQRPGGASHADSSSCEVKTQGPQPESVDSEADSEDSEVCIVKECFVGSKSSRGRGNKQKGEAKKKADRKAEEKTRSARKERKLLKGMKRKWMLEALTLHAQMQGLSRQSE
ncbi:hypothetical protein Efla_006627 [Eimeria flavescens]